VGGSVADFCDVRVSSQCQSEQLSTELRILKSQSAAKVIIANDSPTLACTIQLASDLSVARY